MATTMEMKPLRKCRKCGLEAWNESDLEKFCSSPRYPHGKISFCKVCYNKYKRGWDKDNVLLERYRKMISRCHEPKDEKYRRYGARGISVCDEWRNDRQTFIDWAMANGFKPELTLDRIDNDGPYFPGNCRWATRSQQQLNKRNTTTFIEKGTRICYKCKIEKPLSAFNKSSMRGESGYRRKCRECEKKYMKDYRERKILSKKP